MFNAKCISFLLLFFFFLLFLLPSLLAQEKEGGEPAFSINEPILIIDLKKVLPGETGVPYRSSSVKFDRKGRIYIVDSRQNSIKIFDAEELLKKKER